MKYEKITPVQVILSDFCTEIYMITRVTGELKLDEIRNAAGFVVPIEELPDPVPIDYESETGEPQVAVWDPEPEPVKPKIKSRIDHDKIVSLCQAGWKVADIADECGCSEQTVRNHIARECPNDSDD